MDRSELLMLLLREFAIIEQNARRGLRDALTDGLTEAQFGLLSHLCNTVNRNETPGDLAHLFDISRPAMTQLLGRMVGAGLVTLTPAPRDGRVRHVHLTAAGRSAHAAVIERLAPGLQRLGERFSAAELETLLGGARRFRLELEDADPRLALESRS